MVPAPIRLGSQIVRRASGNVEPRVGRGIGVRSSVNAAERVSGEIVSEH